jgi:hypothetical protein
LDERDSNATTVSGTFDVSLLLLSLPALTRNTAVSVAVSVAAVVAGGDGGNGNDSDSCVVLGSCVVGVVSVVATLGADTGTSEVLVVLSFMMENMEL